MKNKRPYSTKTRLYGIWKNIRRRTRNDKVHGKGYFDRGIKLCQEWYDYTVFRAWALNNGYDDVLTLDRIDNDGNYCPENCRWTDQKTQCNNKRNNHFVTFKGKFQSNQSSTPFKSINLVFTFPELSLPAVNFHWYDMTPGGQTYYVTGTDAGAPELWNWITGNPGEIIGFNVRVISI